MIKAIFFDYHGVLDRHTYLAMLEIIAKSSFQSGDYEMFKVGFMEKYLVLGNAYASGQILPEHFWGQLLHDGFDLETLSQARDFILTIEKNEKLIDQINQIKERFLLGILSDCPLDKLDFIKNAWELEAYFKYMLFSSEIKLDKQDPEFYLEMSRVTKLERNEIFYIDENPECVKMAKKLGFEGVTYNDETDLIKYFSI